MPTFGIPAAVRDELVLFLARYGWTARSAPTELAEGHDNLVLAVEVEIGLVVVRWPGPRDNSNLKFVAELMEHLSGAGYPTPELHRTLEGEVLPLLAGCPTLVTSYVAGQHPAAADRAARVRVGRHLAQFHAATRTFSPSVECRDELWLVRAARQRRDQMLERGWSDFVADLDRFDHDVVPVLQAGWREVPCGFVHGDPVPANVLEQHGQLTALLDFDWTVRGSLVRDVAAAIVRWGSASFETVPDPAAVEDILAGYQQVRPLSDAEHHLLPYALLLDHLSYGVDWLLSQLGTAKPTSNAADCYQYRYYQTLADEVLP